MVPLLFQFIVIISVLFVSIIHSQSSCTVTSIIFTDDGLSLLVYFTEKVSTFGLMDNPSSCSPYFTEYSLYYLSDSQCYFTNLLETNLEYSILLIDLSSTATIQPLFEELTLIPNAFQCTNISQTLIVNPPLNDPNTKIIIDDNVANIIGSCDNFYISAYSSIDVTYRVYDWVWTIRHDLNEYVYRTGQIASLLLTPSDIPFSGEITVTVSILTYLFTSSVSLFKVTKLDLPSPSMNILGASEWIYSRPLSFIVQLSHTACSFDDTLYIFDIKCFSENDNDITSAIIQHSNQFYIPEALLLVGNTYSFKCEATSLDGELVGKTIQIFTVNIVSGVIIASIAGGNGAQLTRNPTTLDSESLSYSWSSIDGSIDNAVISWNCNEYYERRRSRSRLLLQLSTTQFVTTGESSCDCPSFVSNEKYLKIGENMLGDGCKYNFTLTIDNGGEISQDDTIISATSSGSSVYIYRDSYCINENNDIKLITICNTDITSSNAVISQYFWEETTNYLDISSWELSENVLIIPKNTLEPYRTYTFQVSVSTNDPAQSDNSIPNTASIDIIVNDSPTITKFTYISSTNNDYTLETTYQLIVESFSSYEPDSYQFFWRYKDNTTEKDNKPLTSQMSSSIINNIYLPEGELILTAVVYDLCNGATSAINYINVDHNLSNITCNDFHDNIIKPLFETAAAVKDFNRVLNIFDITTTTIKALKIKDDVIDIDLFSSTAMNDDDMYSTTATGDDNDDNDGNSDCYGDIIDSFSNALYIVTQDLDPCIEDTTILSTQILNALQLTDIISTESNEIFFSIVDKIFNTDNCDGDDSSDIPLCNDIEDGDDGYNITMGNNTIDCLNQTDIFSGILIPEQVFRGDEITDQQISITTALLDGILGSSTLTCEDIESTIYQLFNLLEKIVSTDFPGVDSVVVTTDNNLSAVEQADNYNMLDDTSV